MGGTAAASPPPTGIGDPAVCGSPPLVTPMSLCNLETRGFAVFLCFLVCILVKIVDRVTVFGFVCLVLLVVNTSASDCLERLVPEMIYYVSRGTLNSTHSLNAVFAVSHLMDRVVLPM